MAENAKEQILKRVREEGHTDSYGVLLYMAAVMDFDSMPVDSASSLELATWSGHLDGLRASLLCLAMYERKLTPEEAAAVVDNHIADAVDILRPGSNPGSGG